MAGVKQEQTEGQAVIRAKDWVRHTLMKYGMKMEDTAKMSQADAEAMLEACREKKRLSTEKPATESQLAELEKLGIRPSENMTVKQASDAMRDHFRSQAPPATPKQMAWLQAHRLGEGVVTSAEPRHRTVYRERRDYEVHTAEGRKPQSQGYLSDGSKAPV